MSKERFKFRAAGVLIKQEHVLLYRSIESPYWALPGGQIAPGEFSNHALVREMEEELNIDVRVGRLLWMIENIYLKKKKRIHEFGLYYLMNCDDKKLYSGFPQLELSGQEKNLPLLFTWHALEHINALQLYPGHLKTVLRTSLPDTVEHLVCKSV